jgi:hypothetical protein
MIKNILIITCCLLTARAASAGSPEARPRCVITAADAARLHDNLGHYPILDAQYAELTSSVGKAMAQPIDVPVPVDAGGYTHGRHKQNYKEMYGAGLLYSITKDARYASFVRDMLLKYAALYPTLGNHPAGTGPAPGRLFWQTLNEAVWLMNAAQAYDCVYDWIPANERAQIETRLFRPMAKFFYADHAAEFDRIHNHGTWTAAAVAMLGYALRDQSLVDMALYGTKKNRTGGFFRQLDLLFSPDGYYLEGPYYMRYAMEPFFLLAQAIENNQPGLHIFDYRDKLLKKAFYCGMQMTAPSGQFFPINDAMPEKTYLSPEIIIALDITFRQYGGDPTLLGIARRQNSVMLTGAGLAVAQALAETATPPLFPYASVEVTDGPAGDEGGIGILRSGSGEDQEILLMKYAGHGKEHGHFDALTFLFYDQNRAIVQDYGSARFLNVEQKSGGRYLPENKSFAKQTIAHSTITVDARSQHDGNQDAADKHSAKRHFFAANDPSFQVMSAIDSASTPGVTLQRTMALIADARLSKPVVVDIFRAVSAADHQYDLPLYYAGQMIGTNLTYAAHATEQRPLGTANGYQHLWNEAEGTAAGTFRFSWMNGERYYSLLSSADEKCTVFFTRIGANDPEFDLRREPAVVLRTHAARATFASVLEPHGMWNGTLEISEGAMPEITDVRVVASTDEGTVVEITGKNTLHWVLMVTNGRASASAAHAITANGTVYAWTGNAALRK